MLSEGDPLDAVHTIEMPVVAQHGKTTSSNGVLCPSIEWPASVDPGGKASGCGPVESHAARF